MDCWDFVALLRLVGMICWTLRNRVVTSELLMFKGKFIHVKAEEYLMLTCSSVHVPAHCSMEFLHNNATVEILRKSEKSCYSTDRLCRPSECSCNGDCKSYSWNLTTTSVKKDDSFGCGMRVGNSNNVSKVYLTLKYNGTDFNSPTTIIVSENKVGPTLHSNKTSSATNKSDTNKNLIPEGPECWTLMILWCSCGFSCSVLIVCLLLFVLVKSSKYQIKIAIHEAGQCSKPVRKVIAFSLSVSLFVLPYIVGKAEEEHCFVPEAFASYGAVVGVIIWLLLIYIEPLEQDVNVTNRMRVNQPLEQDVNVTNQTRPNLMDAIDPSANLTDQPEPDGNDKIFVIATENHPLAKKVHNKLSEY